MNTFHVSYQTPLLIYSFANKWSSSIERVENDEYENFVNIELDYGYLHSQILVFFFPELFSTMKSNEGPK